MKNILYFCILFGSLGFTSSMPQDTPNKSSVVIKRRGCFIDENHNNVCDNYEKKTCKRADFNEKSSVRKADLCDGSGYSSNQKKEMNKGREKKSSTKHLSY